MTDKECSWSHWAIEYKHGDFSYVHWETMRGLRGEAWNAWEREIETSHSESWKEREFLHRRTGRYRAVKVCAHKFTEPQRTPAAITKDKP
jgi:hypothetical protein